MVEEIMKLIIAGSRTLNPSNEFINSLILFNSWDTTVREIVCGGAKGVDESGRLWCKGMADLCGSDSIKLVEFPADWASYGIQAGPIRNKQMADYADVLLLIWDGESKGSKNMKKAMMDLYKPVYEVILRNHNA